MIVMVCVDDNNGMMFNRRRQSQDRVLRQRMLELTGEKKLWMNAYSRGQFSVGDESRIAVLEDGIQNIQQGEYCFLEDQDPVQYKDQIEELILFRWNRTYPADLHCTLELSNWKLKETEEFTGYSHEKITQERYGREEDSSMI